MGRPKMLLPWGVTSILGHTIAQWNSRAAVTTVVCAGELHPVWAELDRLGFPPTQRITNPNPERGMFESICSSARWKEWGSELTHWALILGDQPLIQADTLGRLVEFARAHPDEVCQPLQGGHRRHPVFLPKARFRELARTTAPTLKDFLEPMRPKTGFCECDDPGLGIDLDQPKDYEAALKRI